MIDLRFTPLTKWPGEQTKSRQAGAFTAKYAQTLDLLEYELAKLHAKEITIQAFFTHAQLRNDGWPFSKAEPSGPGLILSFRTKDGALSFPCDRYTNFDDNLRAIALSLQALRAVDRYGVTRRAEQYSGWKRIEAAPLAGFANKEDAAAFIADQGGYKGLDGIPMIVLNVRGARTDFYRQAARRLHPDSPTGNQELFVKLQQALAMLEADAA